MEHTFIKGKHFSDIKISEDISEVKNVLYFYSDNQETGVKIFKKYRAEDSINRYGAREAFINDDRWSIEENIDDYASRWLEANKTPITEMEFEVIDNSLSENGYDIESIEPGDICKLKGCVDLPVSQIENLVITEVDYKKDRAIIKVSPVKTFFGQVADLSGRIMSQETKQILDTVPSSRGEVGVETRNIFGQVLWEGFEKTLSGITSQVCSESATTMSIFGNGFYVKNDSSYSITEAIEYIRVRPDSGASAKYYNSSENASFVLLKDIKTSELRQKSISFSGWVYTNSKNVSLVVIIEGGDNVKEIRSAPHSGGEIWERLQIENVVIGSDADTVKIGLKFIIGSGEYAYVDNLMVVFGDKAYGYQPVLSIPQDTSGWISISETWTYSSWDSTTKVGVITVPSDATTRFWAGMKVKFTQPTDGTKYGIIVAVGSSTISVFLGQDYDLDNETISNLAVSLAKCPSGFSLDSSKWTIKVTNSTQYKISDPAQNTWYNPGSISINVPIGLWRLKYYVVVSATRNTVGYVSAHPTLSTTTNSETHPELTGKIGSRVQSASDGALTGTVAREHHLNNTENKKFYFLIKTSNADLTGLFVNTGSTMMVIMAESLYL